MSKKVTTPNSCAYALRIGKRFPKLSPSGYKVCVTPTQAKTLFGTERKPKVLGCGVFACAYEHPSDSTKVVKITRDPSDVAGLEQGQGLQVPKLFASRQLRGKPKWITPRVPTSNDSWPRQPAVYALTLERLQPLSPTEIRMWNRRIHFMKRLLKTDPTISKIGELAKSVCATAPDAQKCELRIRELNKISSDLRNRGIEWADIHAGNIGVDMDGRWKAIDLGASPTVLKRKPPLLAD